MFKKCGIFHEEIYALLQQQKFCDVTIMDDSGSKLKAHSCVLAASSTVFKQILCTQPLPVILYQPGIPLVTWKLLLEFMYKGDVNLHGIKSTDSIQALYSAATQWDVRELKLLLTDSSVCLYPNLPVPATSASNKNLQAISCKTSISTQTETVISDQGDDTSSSHKQDKGRRKCRYCSCMCESRSGVIEHVYGTCVKIHSCLKKQQSGSGQSVSQSTGQQKCSRTIENQALGCDGGDRLSGSDEEGAACDRVMDDTQDGCDGESGKVDLATGNLDGGNQQMTGLCKLMDGGIPVTTEPGSGSLDCTVSDSDGALLAMARATVETAPNKPAIETEVQGSLESTRLLLRSISTQNEDSRNNHAEQNVALTENQYCKASFPGHDTNIYPIQKEDLKNKLLRVLKRKSSQSLENKGPRESHVPQAFLLEGGVSSVSAGQGSAGPEEKSVSAGQKKARVKVCQKKHNVYVCLDWNCAATFTKLTDFTSHLRHCLTGGDYVDPEKYLHKKGNTYTLMDDKTPVPPEGVKYPSFHLMDAHCQTHRRKKTKQYRCGHCVHIEVGLGRMLSHVINVHRKVKPFRCWRCEQRFFGFQEIKDHVQRFHATSRTYTCQKCSARFSCKATLSSHNLQEHKHTDETGKPSPRYKCSWCSKSFKLPHQRRRHEMVHLRKEDRPNMCSICGKRFITTACLKTHLLTHTGEKPFRCTKCPFSTTRRIQLQLHMRTHGLQILAYSCATCEAKFTQKTKLEEHLRKLGHVAQKSVGDTMYVTVKRKGSVRNKQVVPSNHVTSNSTSSQSLAPLHTAPHLPVSCMNTTQIAQQENCTRPLDIQITASSALDIQRKASRPLDVKAETSRPLDVQVKTSRPLDVHGKTSRPLDVQVNASRPLAVQGWTGGSSMSSQVADQPVVVNLGPYTTLRRELCPRTVPDIVTDSFRATEKIEYSNSTGNSSQTNVGTSATTTAAPVLHKSNLAVNDSSKVNSDVSNVIQPRVPTQFSGYGEGFYQTPQSDHQALMSSSSKTPCVNVSDKYSLSWSSLNILSDLSVLLKGGTSVIQSSSSTPHSVTSAVIHHLPKTTSSIPVEQALIMSTSTQNNRQKKDSSLQHILPQPLNRVTVSVATTAGDKPTSVYSYLQDLPMFTLLSKATMASGDRQEATVSCPSVRFGRSGSQRTPAYEVNVSGTVTQQDTVRQGTFTSHSLGTTSGMTKPLSVKWNPNPALLLPTTSTSDQPVTAVRIERPQVYSGIVKRHQLPCLEVSSSVIGQGGTKNTYMDQTSQNQTVVGQSQIRSGHSVVSMEKPAKAFSGMLVNNMATSQQHYSTKQSLSCHTTIAPSTTTHQQPNFSDESTCRSYLDQPPPEVMPKVVLQYPGHPLTRTPHGSHTPSVRGNLIGHQQYARPMYTVKDLLLGPQPNVIAPQTVRETLPSVHPSDKALCHVTESVIGYKGDCKKTDNERDSMTGQTIKKV